MPLLTSVQRALLVLCLLPALLVPGGLRTCLCLCERMSGCNVERSTAAESVPEAAQICCVRSGPTDTPVLTSARHACEGCRMIDIKAIDTAQPGPHSSLDDLPDPQLALPAPAFLAAPSFEIASAAVRAAPPRVLDRFDLRLTLRI